MTDNKNPSMNMNREVWRQDMHDPMDLGNYYAPSVFVVGESAIGIDVGGRVNVSDVREWAAMPDELARLRAELEQERYQRAQAQSHSAFLGNTVQRHYDVVAEMGADLAEARADAARFEAALDEIRGICTAMMDGWGQTVTVLDKIRKITLAAIKRQPGEPAHRPETFA